MRNSSFGGSFSFGAVGGTRCSCRGSAAVLSVVRRALPAGPARRQANKRALFAAIGDLLSGFQELWLNVLLGSC